MKTSAVQCLCCLSSGARSLMLLRLWASKVPFSPNWVKPWPVLASSLWMGCSHKSQARHADTGKPSCKSSTRLTRSPVLATAVAVLVMIHSSRGHLPQWPTEVTSSSRGTLAGPSRTSSARTAATGRRRSAAQSLCAPCFTPAGHSSTIAAARESTAMAQPLQRLSSE